MSDPKDIPMAIQALFLAVLPRIEAHAKYKFRPLSLEAIDDAIQKATWLAG